MNSSLVQMDPEITLKFAITLFLHFLLAGKPASLQATGHLSRQTDHKRLKWAKALSSVQQQEKYCVRFTDADTRYVYLNRCARAFFFMNCCGFEEGGAMNLEFIKA